MGPNTHETVDLVTFTEEIPWEISFLSSETKNKLSLYFHFIKIIKRPGTSCQCLHIRVKNK